MKTLLLGDICPTEVTAPLFERKDTETLFGNAASVFLGKDLVFANLECALTDHTVAIRKFGPALKAPRETAEALKTLGVTCCGLSNNHVFDFGVKGAEDTLSALRGAGLEYTGFGMNYADSRRNYTFEQNGERVCIIAVCEHEYSYALENRMGSRPYDEYDTQEDIRAAKKEHDRVIVLYHGGKELCKYSSPRLRRLCRAMARNGADVVLCQHSHCIGAYEEYEGCHILYGQGNFHFVKDYNIPMWHTALMTVYDTETHKIEFLPVKSGDCGISLAKDAERDGIMAEFEARNRTLLDGTWQDGWHTFCEENRAKYEKVLSRTCLADSTERENANFAHYLDCEAHTDVWRELFPTYNQTNEIEAIR